MMSSTTLNMMRESEELKAIMTLLDSSSAFIMAIENMAAQKTMARTALWSAMALKKASGTMDSISVIQVIGVLGGRSVGSAMSWPTNPEPGLAMLTARRPMMRAKVVTISK